MLECQKLAYKNYYEKRKQNGNPVKCKLKYVKCSICDKDYLNTNKSHHNSTKYCQTQKKIKKFINNLE